jgi:hypothetical protein
LLNVLCGGEKTFCNRNCSDNRMSTEQPG